jgi:hypothetical protein
MPNWTTREIVRGAAGDYFRAIHDGPARDEDYDTFMEETLERYRLEAVEAIRCRFGWDEAEAVSVLDSIAPDEALEWL